MTLLVIVITGLMISKPAKKVKATTDQIIRFRNERGFGRWFFCLNRLPFALLTLGTTESMLTRDPFLLL